MSETIGSRIEKARKNKELTQTEFGREIGLSQQAVASLEKRDTIPKHIVKICQILGVSYEFLVTGDKSNTVSTQVDDGNLYSETAIVEMLPIAFNRTIVAMSKHMQANGEKLDIFEHKEEIADFLTKSLIGELSGDYSKFVESYNSLSSKVKGKG
ncbi:helix-turn-helix transcriptional regulator [Pseudoalteromonas maricaloris]|nr:helix-turn-helix transcriptional regulator [Pseudoalteromonas flavipulchra]